jgi:hypothetical protein
MPIDQTIYNKEYYSGENSLFKNKGYAGSRKFQNNKADKIINGMPNIKTSLEFGCAMGLLVERFNEAGIDAHGVEISEYAYKNRYTPKVHLGIDDIKDRKFDLVCSFDCLEHNPVEEIPDMLKMFKSFSNGYQFHEISVSLYRNVGDASKMVSPKGERQDPSHISMFMPEWWEEQFKLVFHDQKVTSYIEDSTVQFDNDIFGTMFVKVY